MSTTHSNPQIFDWSPFSLPHWVILSLLDRRPAASLPPKSSSYKDFLLFFFGDSFLNGRPCELMLIQRRCWCCCVRATTYNKKSTTITLLLHSAFPLLPFVADEGWIRRQNMAKRGKKNRLIVSSNWEIELGALSREARVVKVDRCAELKPIRIRWTMKSALLDHGERK